MVVRADEDALRVVGIGKVSVVIHFKYLNTLHPYCEVLDSNFEYCRLAHVYSIKYEYERDP